MEAPLAPQRFAAAPVERFDDPMRREKIRAALPGIEAMVEAEFRERKMPSLTYGLVVDGELVASKSLGEADLGAHRAADLDTVYRVGSITKTFTALALMRLRDEGKLSLDDAAERYVPELARVRYPTRDAPRITLRMLLSHASGLPRDGRYEGAPTEQGVTETEVRGSLDDLALSFVPGARYQYSNLGFSLLGLAVQRAAGQPLREAVQRLVLGPLGLSSAAWDAEDVPAARLAVGYRRKGEVTEAQKPYRLGASEADGGLYLSLRDLARYAAFQLDAYPPRDDEERGPVRRATVREAHVVGRSTGLDVRRPATAAAGEPVVSVRAGGVGLAWHGSRTCEFEQVVSHDGAVNGHQSVVSMLPAHGVAFVALSNQGNVSVTPLAQRALRSLAQRGLRPRAPGPSTALTAAIEPWLAVYRSWDDARYRDMLTGQHQAAVAMESEKAELAGYARLHGACRDPRLIRVEDAHLGTFALSCERGRLEVSLQVDSATGKIAGFDGRSFELPPSREQAEGAARVAAQIARFDGAALARHFDPALSEKTERPVLEQIRSIHGSCRAPVAHSVDYRGNAYFTLPCERGGDLRLRVHLDPKTPGRIDGYSLTPAEPRTCPAL